MSVPDSPKRPADWLASLQVLRGVAALAVVFYHSINAASRAVPEIHRVYWLQSGVDLFFLISGFVMVHVTRKKVGVPGAAWSFLQNRFIRVVPLYWLYTTMMLVVLWCFPEIFRTQYLNLPQTLHSYLFWPDHRGPYVQVGWTLNFEMFFYVCFTLCFSRAWMRYGILWPGMLLGGLWGLTHAGVGRTGITALMLSPYLLEFLGGMVIATLHPSRFRPPSWVPLLGLAISLAVFMLLKVRTHPVITWGVPLFFLLQFALAHEQQFRRPGLGPLLWLGDASYSLYLTHFFVVAALEKFWLYRLGHAHPIVFIAVAVTLCVIVVYPLWRWIEQPLLELGRRALRPRRTAAVSGP